MRKEQLLMSSKVIDQVLKVKERINKETRALSQIRTRADRFEGKD